MLEIKVTIAAPDLSAAINQLAASLLKRSLTLTQDGITVNGVSIEKPSPAALAIAQPAPAIAQPAQQPVVNAAPAPMPAEPVPAAPVMNPPVIDLDTISRAGAALIDQGKMADVLALLKQFGVPSVNLLDPSQFPAFAEGLKALGASI